MNLLLQGLVVHDGAVSRVPDHLTLHAVLSAAVSTAGLSSRLGRGRRWGRLLFFLEDVHPGCVPSGDTGQQGEWVSG